MRIATTAEAAMTAVTSMNRDGTSTKEKNAGNETGKKNAVKKRKHKNASTDTNKSMKPKDKEMKHKITGSTKSRSRSPSRNRSLCQKSR